MASGAGDVVVIVGIMLIAVWYYAARAAAFRAQLKRFDPPQRTFRFKAEQKMDVAIDEPPLSLSRATGDIRITRSADWLLNDSAKIAPEEWLALVDQDDELELISEMQPFPAKWLGAQWRSNWQAKEDGSVMSLDNGNIVSNKPTVQAVIKMFSIADQLHAIVLDDRGAVIDKSATSGYPFGQVSDTLPSGAEISD